MTAAGAAPIAGQPDPGAAGDDVAPAWRRVLGRELRAFAELFALSGFAIAQPLYDIFGRAPDQFIFRGATGPDIVRFALIVLLVPPLALWALEVVVGLVSTAARRVLHVASLGALVAVFAVQALRSLLTGWPLLVLAAVLGALAGVVYVRTTAARLWLSFAAIAPPAFCALFLFSSPTAQLLDSAGALADIGIDDPHPVVMVVLDEGPLASIIRSDGELDAELYPNLARLADDSTWYRNATGVSNFTWTAAPSIVTGTLPRDGTSPTAASHPNNLFTLLGEGMDLNVVESVTRLCPDDLCDPSTAARGGLQGVLDDAATVLRARLSPGGVSGDPVAGLVEDQAGDQPEQEEPAEAGTPAQRTPGSVQTFIDGIDDDPLGFHYLHVLLPHVPFRYLPDGTQYASPDPDLAREGENWADQPWQVDQARQRHLLQMQYTDAVIGRIVERMEEVGIYDDAIFLLTADHGIGFDAGEGIRGLDNTRPVSDDLLAQLMWVPFFLKAPDIEAGAVDDRDVLSIDIVPTLTDLLGVEVPWEVDGRSVRDEARTATTKGMYRNAVEGASVLAGDLAEIDAAEGWRRVLDHGVDRFVAGEGADRLWRFGPAPELLGTDADDLPALEATFAPYSDASDVDLQSAELPSLVVADVPDARVGEPLAISVNGVVVATAPAVDDEGVMVSAMVPRSAFVDGANDVQVHRIRR